MRALLIAFAFFISPVFVASAADNQHGVWLATFGKKSIDDKHILFTEAQLRYNTSFGSMDQTVIRAGVLRKLNDNHEVGLLFGYVQSNLTKEYRPTLQHIYQDSFFEKTSFTFRSRLEFRDIEDNDKNSLRYRLMTRVVKPINDQFDFATSDEIFVNLTKEDWTGNRVFDRNRFFVGVVRKYENLSLETGYMNQYVPRDRDTWNHLLVVNLYY